MPRTANHVGDKGFRPFPGGSSWDARAGSTRLVVAVLLVLSAATVVLLLQPTGGGRPGGEDGPGGTTGRDSPDPARLTSGPPELPDQVEAGGPEGVRPPSVAGREAVDALVLGRVGTPKWLPFPGPVTIELHPQDGTEAGPLADPDGVQRVRADAEVRKFRFERVPFGNWRVLLEEPGYQSVEVLLSLGPNRPDADLVLTLLPANHLFGIVRDETGSPVVGFDVTALRVLDDVQQVPRPVKGRTDAEGRFDLSGIQPGHYRVFAGTQRAWLGEPQDTNLSGREAYVELTVPLTEKATVRVVDPVTGEGVPNARVAATEIATDGRAHAASTNTDASGDAVFAHLPPGDYVFKVYGTGYRHAERRATLRLEEPLTLEFKIQAANVSGGR